MRLLNNHFFQSLVVVLVQNRCPTTAGLIGEPVKPQRFPLFEPSRDGITANLQNVTDLVDGMALITQQDGMRAST